MQNLEEEIKLEVGVDKVNIKANAGGIVTLSGKAKKIKML
jgi:hypothetical protein